MPQSPEPAYIAVDWGTSNLRAYLVGTDGLVLDQRHSEKGVQSVEPSGFAGVLATICGDWRQAHMGIPVLMAGMIGSRNGWIEAPYVRCPAGADEIAARLIAIPADPLVSIVPGLDCRWPDGPYDVIRGEETQTLGVGMRDGVLCLPGTHSKWIEVAGGRLVRFATFITGELFAAMGSSFMGRLAENPEDPAGAVAGARTAALPGGLLRGLFQTRARVLGGDMTGNEVKPFLSGLIVQTEIREALEMFGAPEKVTLIAGAPQSDVYRHALLAEGCSVEIVDPRTAFLTGIGNIAAMRQGAAQ